MGGGVVLDNSLGMSMPMVRMFSRGEAIFARLGYDCPLQSDNGATDHALSFQLG